jgi:NAD(P)H-hydrate epimerase
MRLRDAAEQEMKAMRRIGIKVTTELRLDAAKVVVDAIFGTGLSRRPEGTFATWIEAINSSGLPVIAVDVPSGLDADTGVAYAPSVQARTTVTLGLPKPGLLAGDGPRLAGEIWVADIGVPFEAYSAIGLTVPQDLFANGDRVRLDGSIR